MTNNFFSMFILLLTNVESNQLNEYLNLKRDNDERKKIISLSVSLRKRLNIIQGTISTYMTAFEKRGLAKRASEMTCSFQI